MDVSDGLWLEDRGARLAWFSTLEELRTSTAPDFSTVNPSVDPPTTIFCWSDRVWGGLRCQVTTAFGVLEHSGLWLTGVRLAAWRTPLLGGPIAAHFGWLQYELVERFGPPVLIRDDGEEGRAIWQLGDVTLRHEYMDTFGWYHEVFLFV